MNKSTTDESPVFSYAGLDDFKLLAQAGARKTIGLANRLGIQSLDWTRGESVFVVKFEGRYLGFTIEGLGTKNLVADKMREILEIARLVAQSPVLPPTFYDSIAQCCVAMIVNDPLTLGILPAVIAMHPAVESDAWFKDQMRNQDLVNGWVRACMLASCEWGPGETPGLKGIIVPDTLCLSGAVLGTDVNGVIFDPKTIQAGDAIAILTSSGIHANGLTDCRAIGNRVGYDALLSDGRTFGEALLDPTHIYVDFIEDCILAGIEIHYGVNITGHGWRKFMRAIGDFTYVIHTIPKPQPVFDFIQKNGSFDERDMYGKFNMGAGFALYGPKESIPKMQLLMERGSYPYQLINAGTIVADPKKSVMIEPKGITFTPDELSIR